MTITSSLMTIDSSHLSSRRQLLAAASGGLLLAAFCSRTDAQPAQMQRETRSRDWFTESSLLDQDGNARRFYSDLLAPRTVLMHVVFTTCSSACPLIVQHLQRVRAELGVRFARDVWFLSISVDPLNDTPARLKSFASKYDADVPGWRFLTGQPETVELVTRRLGLWASEPDAHNTALIAGHAARGRWTKPRPDATPAVIAQRIVDLQSA